MDSLNKLLSTLPVDQAAKRLLGCEFERNIDGQITRVRIVETEAYHQTDAASHSFNGITARTSVMFGPAGKLYVYFTYGMHYCCNVVTGPEGEGSAVLIRAVEPVGDDSMLIERRNKTGVDITNGPAKLCQALAIDTQLNGHDLNEEPFQLFLKPDITDEDIIQTTRIGISKAVDAPLRFYIKESRYVSKQ